jgi:hypothetical protein
MKHGFKPRRCSDGRLTPADLVLRYFPTATRRGAGDTILFALTGWPAFWHDKDGKTPLECCRKQLYDAASRVRRGITIDQQIYEAWDAPMERMQQSEAEANAV